MSPSAATILLIGVWLAAVIDLRTRHVPDAIPLAILVLAIAGIALGWLSHGWLAAGAGLLLGLALGAPLFALGGWGGGDVKLLAALGAALGPLALLQVAIWMGVAGGALALVAAARGKRDLAYVPAIAVGLLVNTIWPHALGAL
ncbi:MAG TPA: prepilin peptidase [Pirellulales bacterium]|nr:prepilin peptidase [Pirellulales bacterium]